MTKNETAEIMGGAVHMLRRAAIMLAETGAALNSDQHRQTATDANRRADELESVAHEAELLTTNEAAAALHVHPNTIKNMVRTGRLPAARTGAGDKNGHIRISRADIEALKK